MNDIAIRPATAEDIIAVCGGRVPVTARAYTVTLNGEPVCVAGILMTARPVVFSNFTPVDVPKRTIWRTAKLLLEKLRAIGIPAVTSELCGRSRFLESLGLELDHVNGNHYFYRI